MRPRATCQALESTRLLVSPIEAPAEYEQSFWRYSSSLIFRLGFGKVMQDRYDPLMRKILRVLHHVERVGSPGAYLADTFPALMYLPDWLAPFKRELKGLHREELNVFRGLMGDVRAEMEGGKAPESWERHFLERREEYGLTDDQGAYVIGTLL